jgi:hypothetical protein
MESKVKDGYLLLADLSGFTQFMASAELEHAQEIITELINTVCKSLKPVFNIAEIEGDAIFAYTFDEQLSRGETLIELIELTYYNFTFRKNIMEEKSTCSCRACQSIRNVDLKFINHYGSFALQNYSGNIKPLGSDVNLAHRLLKNGVKEKTDIRSYALFSDNCIKKINLTSEIFIPLTEKYEHFGDIATYVTDLSDSYKKLSETNRTVVKEEDADFIAEHQFEMPAAVLWEWLVDNTKRQLWMEDANWEQGERPRGRMGAGATNHCVHGKDAHLEVILDWKPFEYYTYESGSKPLFVISTLRLVENEKGTMLYEIIKLKNKLPKFLKRLIVKFIALKIMKVYEGYRKIDRLSKRQIVGVVEVTPVA